MVRVERAGDLQRDDPGLGRGIGGKGLDLLDRACGDDLAAAVGVGRGEPRGDDGGVDFLGVAAEHRGHAGGRCRCGKGHGVGAFAHEDHRVVFAQRAGKGGCGDLADGVAGKHGVGREGLAEERAGRNEPGGHDQRLGDGGVLDGFLVGDRSVGREVTPGDGGKSREVFGDTRDFQPWGKESGGLGALSWAHDC